MKTRLLTGMTSSQVHMYSQTQSIHTKGKSSPEPCIYVKKVQKLIKKSFNRFPKITDNLIYK